MEQKMNEVVTQLENRGFNVNFRDDFDVDSEHHGLVTATKRNDWNFTVVHVSFFQSRDNGDVAVSSTIGTFDQRPKGGETESSFWDSRNDDIGDCPLNWLRL